MKDSNKERFGRFITNTEKIDRDINTDFYTPQTMSYQAICRTLGDDKSFNLEYFRKKGDMLSSIYWSNDRKSRAEVVEALSTSQLKDVLHSGVIPRIIEQESQESDDD